MAERLISAALLIGGIYALMAAFNPSIRLKWEGSQIVTGTVSNLGFAVVFVSFGIFYAIPIHNQDNVLIGLVVLAFLTVLIGRYLDFGRLDLSTGSEFDQLDDDDWHVFDDED